MASIHGLQFLLVSSVCIFIDVVVVVVVVFLWGGFVVDGGGGYVAINNILYIQWN